MLIASGADVHVITRSATPAVEALSQQRPGISLELREYRDGDLDGAWYAIAATDAPDVNAAVVAEVLTPLYETQCARWEEGDLLGYRDFDLKFHRSIWHASGNLRLSQVADNLGGQIRLAWSSRMPGTAARALREHRATGPGVPHANRSGSR